MSLPLLLGFPDLTFQVGSVRENTSGWKPTHLTSVTSPHGTTLMAFADVCGC